MKKPTIPSTPTGATSTRWRSGAGVLNIRKLRRHIRWRGFGIAHQFNNQMILGRAIYRNQSALRNAVGPTQRCGLRGCLIGMARSLSTKFARGYCGPSASEFWGWGWPATRYAIRTNTLVAAAMPLDQTNKDQITGEDRRSSHGGCKRNDCS